MPSGPERTEEEKMAILEGDRLMELGHIDIAESNYDEALGCYQAALNIFRRHGARRGEATALGNLAHVHRYQDRIPEALEHYQQALAIHREVGNRRNQGTALGSLGALHHEQGRIPEALEHYQQALAIHREVGNRRNEGAALGSLATLHHDQGRIPEALEHYQQALAIHREVGDRLSEGVTLGNLGGFLASQGDLLSAGTHLVQAITIGDETMPGPAGAFRGSLALIRARQGAFDEARSLLQRGEVHLRGVHKLELGKLLCKKARVEHLAGDPAAAATALAEAESIAAELGPGPDSELGKLLAEARDALTR